MRINLAGGEPLLSKNIQKIIDYIYSKGIEVSIITNGYYLTEEFIKGNRNKLSMIGLSVDSFSEETNLKIGRCCNYNVLSEQAIIQKALLIKEYGIKLKINICLSKYNQLEDFRKKLLIIGADRVKLLRIMTDHNSELSNLKLSNSEWKEVVKNYKKIPNIVFEDNDYMKSSYIIIDSDGNLSKNNLHLSDNSIIKNNISLCFKRIREHKEVL